MRHWNAWASLTSAEHAGWRNTIMNKTRSRTNGHGLTIPDTPSSLYSCWHFYFTAPASIWRQKSSVGYWCPSRWWKMLMLRRMRCSPASPQLWQGRHHRITFYPAMSRFWYKNIISCHCRWKEKKVGNTTVFFLPIYYHCLLKYTLDCVSASAPVWLL